MAVLWIRTRRMTLPDTFRDINDLKADIVPVLVNNAFSDVVNTDGEVAGNRGVIRLSVIHLPIFGRDFYQQVIASGEDADGTLFVVEDIQRQIAVG
ncbi:hypothetical protein [Nocardia concava]|uniref:hypothetical protein n=1 Tax=Nocardia concava TaxID=257281 RepID=UPI0002D9F830|nr:hypothetical protein [Nocardia concava]